MGGRYYDDDVFADHAALALEEMPDCLARIVIGRPSDGEQDIEDLIAAHHGKVFHAGTALKGDTVVTSGGRVLCAVALGDTTAAAQHAAYELVREIDWPNVYYRTDIGYRAVKREQTSY